MSARRPTKPDTRRSKSTPRCISCGCTESRACLVTHWGKLQGCSWILLDNKRKEGLCSACATVPQMAYAMLARAQGFTIESLSHCIGRSKARVKRALEQLERRGLAEADRVGSRAVFWRLVRHV